MLRGGAHEVILGEHIYQPPRRASHTSLRDVSTDPEGKDWTEIITNECYEPQAELGIFDAASFDMYGALRRELRDISPETMKTIHEAMRAHGVGDPYIHPILPDLSSRDKAIVILAGKKMFEQEAHASPKWFWPPETALDNDTLEVLIDAGYKGVLCAPEQVWLDAGRHPESQLVQLRTESGRNILAFPFDRPVSSALAFQDKSNAEVFARETILPRLNWLGSESPRLFWTDGETFGHHAKFADKFLAHLLFQSLPQAGVGVLPINELNPADYRRTLETGTLIERSAWSCPHGDLVRWHGSCPCCWGDETSWKESFYQGFAQFNESISVLLDREMGGNWSQKLVNQFSSILHNPGGTRNSERSLLSAKASSLTARTSCGTFYGSAHTSGRINALFAQQSLAHLRDAGLHTDADRLEQELAWNLESMHETTDESLAAYFSGVVLR